ncbi:uncharacterized protein LOC115225734 [Octopus sinensis]|uniref:Uncharacterized protein LOC115225734 n=1 Tax=Octopus sinensis TaxID=2607531 RepID=A0A6P7TKR9_9MOLL|nr:uncharacterized protein LOC115225734 [Octopus sinensis]
MGKIWYCSIIKYLQGKRLAHKDVHADTVATIEDDAPSYSVVISIVDDFLSTVQKLAAEFRRGILEDDPRFRSPATATTEENIDHVHNMVIDNRLLTLNQIANAIGISR